MSGASYQVFFIAWWIAVAYVASLCILGLRLGWMRSSGRYPDAPTAMAFWSDRMGWGPVAFIFSGRHKSFSDPMISMLVLLSRTLFVIYVPLFAYLLFSFYR